jgi:hypothetical protein
MRSFVFVLLLTLTANAQSRNIQNEIHTVLPQDAIPAIFDPEFVSVSQADVHKDAPMIAVSINGEHHAYSMYMLNRHEIVNDIVGGDPIATTW